MSLRICFVASEIAPFAKTGGLADVVSGLGRWLGGQGHDVRMFMPLYGKVARDGDGIERDERIGSVRLGFGAAEHEVRFATGRLPDSEVTVHFVDCPAMFSREPIYSFEYPDEHVRFALFSRAVLEGCQRLGWAPDVFHCNDWHTGLLPLYLRTLYAWDGLFHPTKTLLTIHNIGFQGEFPAGVVDELGLNGERHLLHQQDLYERHLVNFLKTGVLYADRITTVSETYAWEIRTPEGGQGLEGVLNGRAGSLKGIVNGVDYGTWDPAVDPLIPARFTAADPTGKETCKRRLLERFQLRQDGRPLVFGIVTRLTPQKGLDLLREVLPVVLRDDAVRIVALGSGEHRYEEFLQRLRDHVPDRVGIYLGYNEELAHWIEAGADAFLMPSQFEPCGLNQMYSLRYGTPPIVRRTGGLADTVHPFDPATGAGTGFVFDRYDPHALLEAMSHARRVWEDPAAWRRLMANGMAEDFSWHHQGPRYVELYRNVGG